MSSLLLGAVCHRSSSVAAAMGGSYTQSAAEFQRGGLVSVFFGRFTHETSGLPSSVPGSEPSTDSENNSWNGQGRAGLHMAGLNLENGVMPEDN